MNTGSIRLAAVRKGLLAAVCCAAAIAPAAAAEPGGFTAATSPGGLPFYFRNDTSTPFAAISFGLRDGFPAAVKGKEGFPSLAGSLVLQGADSGGPSEFVERLRDISASASISFGTQQTSGSVRAPSAHLGEAMALVSAALKSAKPTERLLKRLKQQAVGAEAQAVTRSETIALRAALQVALGDHPATRSLDPARYERLALTDLDAWRKRVLDRAKLQVVASGKVSEKEVAAIIDRAFGDLPARLDPIELDWPPVSVSRRTIVVEREGAQTAILMVGLARIESGISALTGSVANAVLGGGSDSRLWKSVRAGMGATYGASSGFQVLDPKQRLVMLRASVGNDQARAALDAMRAAYVSWRESGVTAAELNPVRSRLLNDMASAMTDPSRANSLLLTTLLAGRTPADLAAYEPRLQALTPEEINSFIRARFPPLEELITVVVAPAAGPFGPDCIVRALDEVATCKR